MRSDAPNSAVLLMMNEVVKAAARSLGRRPPRYGELDFAPDRECLPRWRRDVALRELVPKALPEPDELVSRAIMEGVHDAAFLRSCLTKRRDWSKLRLRVADPNDDAGPRKRERVL